jgi:hypothetical protein
MLGKGKQFYQPQEFKIKSDLIIISLRTIRLLLHYANFDFLRLIASTKKLWNIED